MALIEQIRLLRRIDGNIIRKKTGTAQKLASFMGISRTQIFYYFEILRSELFKSTVLAKALAH